MTKRVPGWEGSVGPFPGQYGQPHVYARDVHSGAGNCVCGLWNTHPLHVQVGPRGPIVITELRDRRRCQGCDQRMILWRWRWAHRRCAATLGRARDQLAAAQCTTEP